MPDRDSVFIELFRTHHKSLINYCVSRGIRTDKAEDIVSEAFTRALAKSDQVLTLEPKQQKAWLYTAVSFIVKENNSRVSPMVFSEIENIENYITEIDDLEQFQSEEDYQQYVRQVYHELETEKERELFRLILNEKIDYRTLSQKYDASPGTLRVMISRFRGKLREIVNKILTD